MRPRELHVAVLQCALAKARELNVARVIGHIRDAAELGAQIIVTPELFQTSYFPQEQDADRFDWAEPVEGNKTLARMCKLAKELDVVLPYSFFEREGNSYFNSVAVIDATGAVLGVYRKSHIPDGAGYYEKYYFRPGAAPPEVWATRHGRVGVGICWDQWFPEHARALALLGAEILLYPSAIGTEPGSEEDTLRPWRRVMIGHAVASSIPIAAANRVGAEGGLEFYGSSFICDPRGDLVAQLGRGEAGVAHHIFDRDALKRRRAAWGFFRDRRPELYGALTARRETSER